MRLTMTGAILATTFLAACKTNVQSGDTDPPTLTVLDLANDDAVVFTSDPNNTPSPVACDNGALPFGLPSQSINDNGYYILPQGVTGTTLLINFFDPSGIQSARLSFPLAGFEAISPALPIITNPTDGNDNYSWVFDETGQLRSSTGLSLRIGVSADDGVSPLTTMSFTATDGAGNEIPNGAQRFFFVSSYNRACRTE